MKLSPLLFLLLLSPALLFGQKKPDLRNQQLDGYQGIWFELNQKYTYGDKYSGGLGTYTAKHNPLAIYAPEVNKTFFVYGGTTDRDARHLLAMIGEFDHATQTVSRPTVVYDKQGVDDPHDNPSLSIDAAGYLWVFVSGRGTLRPGIKLRSSRPFDIRSFELLGEEEFTYPQIWHSERGFFHFFTKYSGTRELYFETSPDGISWTEDRMLAGIKQQPDQKSGHYQLSAQFGEGEIVGTFFNRHLDGHPDTRTDLYYLQSTDFGNSWQDIQGNAATLPLRTVDLPSRVHDYRSQEKNAYLKDMAFDGQGRPICLHLISGGHEPGPDNAPYQWRLTRWDGEQWLTTQVAESDHNYDMGSLFVSDSVWRIIAPTDPGPQAYGVGGEVISWISQDQGESWQRERSLTENSKQNHAYVRKVLHGKAPFCFFWADGNPHEFSKSELFFGDFEGNVWKLPYEMTGEWATPLRVEKVTEQE